MNMNVTQDSLSWFLSRKHVQQSFVSHASGQRALQHRWWKKAVHSIFFDFLPDYALLAGLCSTSRIHRTLPCSVAPA